MIISLSRVLYTVYTLFCISFHMPNSALSSRNMETQKYSIVFLWTHFAKIGFFSSMTENVALQTSSLTERLLAQITNTKLYFFVFANLQME